MATEPLLAYAKRGPYDNIATPFEATDYLVPFLHLLDQPDHKWPVLWESAPPKRGASRLGRRLEHHGFRVVEAKGTDSLLWEPADRGEEIDIQVTNPPYSLKAQWIERTFELDKPAALLLPITTLGVARVHKIIAMARIILLPRRVDFTGKRRPWFSVAWFLWRFPLDPGIHLAVEWQDATT